MLSIPECHFTFGIQYSLVTLTFAIQKLPIYKQYPIISYFMHSLHKTTTSDRNNKKGISHFCIASESEFIHLNM